MKKIFILILSIFINLCNIPIKAQSSWIETGYTTFVGHANFVVNDMIVQGLNLFVASNTGFLRSTDDGQTWSHCDSGLTSIDIRCLFYKNGVLYAGTTSGLFMSVNNGSYWTSLNGSWPGPIPWISQIFEYGNCALFVGTWHNGIFKSLDNGNTWTSASVGLTSFGIGNFLEMNTILYTDAGGTIYASTDTGNTWTPWNLSPPGLNRITGLYSNGNDLFILSTQPNEIYYSNNYGNSWTNLASGIFTSYYFLNDILFLGNNIYVSTYDGPMLSNDYGITWLSDTAGLFYPPDKGTFVNKGNIVFYGYRNRIYYNDITTLGNNTSSFNFNRTLSVFPNPILQHADNKIYIQFLDTEKYPYQFVIYYYNGEIFYEGKTENNIIEFGNKNISKGIYFISIEREGRIYSKKLVVE